MKDKRVKAVISQCPFTSGLHSSQTVGVLPLLKLAVLGVRDLLFSSKDKIVPVSLVGNPGDGKCIHVLHPSETVCVRRHGY